MGEAVDQAMDLETMEEAEEAQAMDPGGRRRNDGVPRGAHGQRSLPLKLMEPLGSAGYKDEPMFDLKLAEKEDYKYLGSKNCLAWKRKVENHFISVAPGSAGVGRGAGHEHDHAREVCHCRWQQTYL